MSITALPFDHCQPRNPKAMPTAFLVSLALHLLALFFIGYTWHQAASRPAQPLRIEFLGNPKPSDTPPPEQVEALAEANQRATADHTGERERQATSPLPVMPMITEPLLTPQAPQTQASPWEGQPAPAVPLVARIATPRSDHTAPVTPPQPKKTGESTRVRQEHRGESPSLKLSASLGEVARWDRQRQEQESKRKKEAGEASVNINTREVRYATYFRGVKQQVEQVWTYPAAAREQQLTGNLLMEFTISADGRLLEIEVLRSSGWPVLDDAAIKAVRKASPFSPLPESWKLDKLRVKATFEYLRRSFTWGE